MPNENNYNTNLPPTPVYLPMVPPEVLRYLAAADANNCRLAVENEQYRMRLQARELREDAYSSTWEMNQRTWTMTESGRPVELLDFALNAAARVVPQGPEKLPACYVLRFTGKNDMIIIDEPSYLDDKSLLHSLQINGIGVTIRRSTRTTAALIRQHISKVLATFYADQYGGWTMTGQKPEFFRFQIFSSHQGENPRELACPVAEVSLAVATVAAGQLAQTFQAILAPILRWLLFTWSLAAFLFSLLEPAGSSLSLGLCLYTRNPMLLAWLERLFCWYGDAPINLDDRPAEFARALWNRKDQPAVVIDHHRTGNAARNATVLEEVLATGKIPWKDGRREKVVPLRAPVVILSDTISSLCCAPKLLTLDIQPADFDLELCRQQCEQPNVLQDYLQALASFTAAHWPELQEALRRGRVQVATFADAEDRDALSTAGTLLGMAAFAETFCRSCGIEDLSVLAEGEVPAEAVAELLDHATTSISGMDIAGQFCRVAQRCLADGVFSICDADRDDSDGTKPVVYRIQEDYGFPAAAFRTVCHRISQSTPVIAQALSEAGLLRGKRTNATTVQTRIPVTNVYGRCRYVGVYRIAQEHILSEML